MSEDNNGCLALLVLAAVIGAIIALFGLDHVVSANLGTDDPRNNFFDMLEFIFGMLVLIFYGLRWWLTSSSRFWVYAYIISAIAVFGSYFGIGIRFGEGHIWKAVNIILVIVFFMSVYKLWMSEKNDKAANK